MNGSDRPFKRDQVGNSDEVFPGSCVLTRVGFVPEPGAKPRAQRSSTRDTMMLEEYRIQIMDKRKARPAPAGPKKR